ncbi:MAG: hypothetical protein QOJ99_1276 [Bryobacterales bacterium]|nr:hypothetical protein [Bryobacterales bacterium]
MPAGTAEFRRRPSYCRPERSFPGKRTGHECGVRELAGQTFTAFQVSATRLDLFEGLAATGEFGHNGIDGCSPDERLRVFVPGCRKFVDDGDEVPDAQEGIAADALVREFRNQRSIRFNQLQLVGT